MGLEFVVMFIGSFMDDVTYVSDVEVCMCSKKHSLGCLLENLITFFFLLLLSVYIY